MTRLLSFILALLVTLTTVHMGQARGVMASVAGHVTICNGQGTEVLTLDVSGDPVEVSHSCPDCLVVFAAADSLLSYGNPQPIHIHTLAQAAVVTLETPLIPKTPPARGPPLSV